MKAPPRPTDIRRRRFGASVRAALAVALAAGILASANALSARLYARWTPGARMALSERTLEALRATAGVVEATAVFERDHPFRGAARELLEELADAAGSIPGLEFRIRAIDVNHDLSEAAEAFRRHPGLAPNSIVFSHGGRSRAVDEFELAGETGFDGERACVSALFQLVRPARSAIYFLSGHGEYDPNDRHPVLGASAAARALAANGFTSKTFAFAPGTASVPSDCGVLVSAGPRTMFPQRERELLADYLSDGGRFLLLADNALAGGLGPVLAMWGLRLEPPPAGSGRAASSRRSALSYGDHPAVRGMDGILTVFTNPCGVVGTEPPGSAALPPRVSPVVSVDEPDGPPRCVAAVSSAVRSPRAETRLAVFGDADFVSNALLDGGFEGNAMLFVSAVEWLFGHDRPVVASSGAGGAFDAGVGTDRGWNRLAAALALGVPAAILAFGLLLYVPFARRR